MDADAAIARADAAEIAREDADAEEDEVLFLCFLCSLSLFFVLFRVLLFSFFALGSLCLLCCSP